MMSRGNHVTAPMATDEPMVGAREAAYIVNLPAYWLVDAKQRHRLNVPYYRIGHLLRFRASELEHWAEQRAAADGESHA